MEILGYLRQSISTNINNHTINPSIIYEKLEDNAIQNSWSWFIIGEPPISLHHKLNKEIYVQDTVHIGTKFRTRILKPNAILPMGNYFVSID